MSVETARDVAGAYFDSQYFRLQAVAGAAERLVVDSVAESGIYAHQVSSRVKTRDSFTRKASKVQPDGSLKYEDPTVQITDLIGVRVVVSIAADVPDMAAQIRRIFHVVEEIDRGNEIDVDRPGYRSLHLVVRLTDETPRLLGQPLLGTDIAIEIQIRSILQDALASFEHDLVYKAERTPTAATRRRLVEVASLLHVADRLFSQVRDDALAETEAVSPSPTVPLPPEDHATGWSDRDLEDLLQQIVGTDEADSLPWLRELRRVLDSLGYPAPQEFAALLPRLTGGPGLARRLRQDQPWLTATQVLDSMLRAELGTQYFDSRATPDRDTDLSARDRAAFDRQVQQIQEYREELV